MGDSEQDSDARPLTRKERENLAKCLLGLCSAISALDDMQVRTLEAVQSRTGVLVDVSKEHAALSNGMLEALNNLETLSRSLGVDLDG